MRLKFAAVVGAFCGVLMSAPAVAQDGCVAYINSHPAVSAVMSNPGLIYDQHYLNEHPNFKHFLNRHPGICDNFARMGTRQYEGRRRYEAAQPYNKEQRVEREQRMHKFGAASTAATPGTHVESHALRGTEHGAWKAGAGATAAAAASPAATHEHKFARPGGDSNH